MWKHKVFLPASAAFLLVGSLAEAQATLRFTTATGTETFVAGITPGEVKCQGAQPNPVPPVYFLPCPAGVKGTVRGQVVQAREDSTDLRTTGLNTVTGNANLHADGTMEVWGTFRAQVAPQGTVLTVDVENVVNYLEDPVTVDLSKVGGTVPGVTTPVAFYWYKAVRVGDITAVNGQPVKGTSFWNWRTAVITPNAVGPGPNAPAIGDITRSLLSEVYFEVLGADGSQIGTIIGLGMGGGPPAPGAPLAAAQSNFVIAGGSGAFLGARGYFGAASGGTARSASMTEDAANRRINGGGRMRFVMHLIPMSWPEVVVTPTGPLVFHSDFSAVTSDRPARPGETLIVFGKGLGPTNPGVNPGDPFPREPLAVVTSPVEVLVDGKASPAINQVGVPGTTDTYRVDFRVPDATAAGMVPIQVSAAWVKGTAVRIPVR